MAEIRFDNATILIEVRKSNYNGHYAIRIVDREDTMKVYYNWSQTTTWSMIKAYLKRKNIVCPTIKQLRLFSDGFGYSYGWFDPCGNVIGR